MFPQGASRVRSRQRMLLVAAAMVVLCLWVAMSMHFLRGGADSNNESGSHHGVPPRNPSAGGKGRGGEGQPSGDAAAGFGRGKKTYPPAAAATCHTRPDCLSCMFPSSLGAVSFLNPPVAAGDCVWCASDARCVANRPDVATTCGDVEDAVCPAILVTSVPQNHRVIHVGIRKGGPEALVQMHLALLHWGFNTTLDTRKSMKEKGGPVMPFFLDVYRSEFDKAPPLRWVRNYDDWHNSAQEGDVMIATETWMCKADRSQYLPRGVRQMQWHLTVWPRRDRSQCTIAGHTNYVARDYMRQSVRSLMYPYISPHILKLAASKPSWRGGKQDLVLYDSDTHLKDADLESRHGVARTRKIATGYTPQQLYELYGTAKAGIDLQLPGGERFIYEAALFDVCVIVDDALNGADREDFPIPDRFRVKPGDLDALNAAVDTCVRDYDRVIEEFAPLKQLVLQQRVTFLRQVRRYFSNSVHIATVVCTQEDMDQYAARFLLATLIQIPFAVVELFVPRGVAFDATTQRLLHDNSLLAAVFLTTMDAAEVAEICGAPMPSSAPETHTMRAMTRLQPTTNERRSLVTMWLALNVVIMSEDVVHTVVTQLMLLRRASGTQRTANGKPRVPLVAYVMHLLPPPRPQPQGAEGASLQPPTTAVPLVAVFTAKRHLLLKMTCVERNLHNMSCRLPVAVDPLALEPLRADQLDHVAQLIALVGGSGEVVWGAQQMLDESVGPFLCTHELWRRIVGAKHTKYCGDAA